MSEGSEQEGEKTHDPTEQRLDDARRRGDIARSNDLSAFGAYFGLLIALVVGGEAGTRHAGEILASFLSRADLLSTRILSTGGAGLSLEFVLDAISGLVIFFSVPALFVLIILVGQRAIVFAPEKLEPKLNRISPVLQAKQKFGISGFFEFGKSASKLTIITVVLMVFLSSQTDVIVGLVRAAPKAIPGAMAQMAMSLLAQITIVAFVIGLADYLWQHFDHRRKLRMTQQELKEEIKKSEGDPALKSKRRQRGEEIAMNRMMTEVPKASVIVVNPTHYAVALKWDRVLNPAPIVVAKGVDEVALQIRRVADESGVPIYSDPPTARLLEAEVPLKQEIEPAHYRAVAAAIRFADVIRAKSRERSG